MSGEQLFYDRPTFPAQLDMAHPLTRGLVGCWVLNDSGLRAWDSSPYKNHGTASISNGRWQGRIFDGTNDYLSIPDAAVLNPTNNFTLITWVRVDRSTAAGLYDGIVCKRDSALGTGYMLYTTSNAFAISAYATGNNLDITASITHTLRVFNCVALVVNAGNGTLYMNALPVGTDTCNDINVNASPLRLSSYDNAVGTQPSEPFQGIIGEVLLYNRALILSDIKWLYHEPYDMFLR